MEKIKSYKPGIPIEIKLEKFDGKTEDFTIKLPGGLGILELQETALEATYESSGKKSKGDMIKIGISKESVLITKFFEDYVLGGRKAIKNNLIDEIHPKSLKKLVKWIEDNIFSQIPSEDSDQEAENKSESTED